MNFDVKQIEPKFVWIIDIWTYKIRVGICKVFNRNVELIWYWEKRQDLDDISLQEIKNKENVCENVRQALEKAEIDAKIKVKEVMISIPTLNIFFETSTANYIKQEPEKSIDNNSMYNILKDIELNIFNPFMNINTNYDVFISSLSEYSEDEGKNMVYNDLKNNEGKKINVFKDFIDFSEKFLLDFINNQRFTDFTGVEIKKNGFIIQIIPFYNDEMKEDNYTLKGEKSISGNKIKYKLTADDLLSENSTILTEKSKEKLKQSLENE